MAGFFQISATAVHRPWRRLRIITRQHPVNMRKRTSSLPLVVILLVCLINLLAHARKLKRSMLPFSSRVAMNAFLGKLQTGDSWYCVPSLTTPRYGTQLLHITKTEARASAAAEITGIILILEILAVSGRNVSLLTFRDIIRFDNFLDPASLPEEIPHSSKLNNREASI